MPIPVSRATDSGFTLVEVLLATAIAAIGVLGGSMAIVSGSKLQSQTREYGDAMHAARNVYEQLRNGDLATRMQDYQAQPNFQVRSLDVTVTFPANLVPQILGQTVPTGRFVDTDGDGMVEVDPASTERASLLPVQVVVQWGQGSRLVSTFLVTER